ncbi:uncharacterized protein BXZ73DRAFT_96344 [Epithele typhae]|uniref:uncharacterized protein n=1 Tax=Epithele typhae TaxID=378194 RepID=UPI002007BABD|nr:uncharacterized protein BXZ73DRAFT_96344 [Epithele typhae]KAH9945353.1 hypothetical protein BXZ73DRAFT_96344 [Epithele typhae]
MARVFLERAGQAPLTVTMNICAERIDHPFSTSERAHQIQHLHISGSWDYDEYLKLIPSSSPLLESVVLDAHGTFSKLRKPSYFFPQSHSTIRGLAIAPVQSILPLDSFPNLTHLWLSFKPVKNRGEQLADLPQVFSRTPSLQYLHVCGARNGHGLYDFQPPPEHLLVALPQLRNLTLVDFNWSWSCAFLRVLVLPDDADVYIHRPRLRLEMFEETSPIAAFPRLALIPFLDRARICLTVCTVTLVAEGPLATKTPYASQRPHGRLFVFPELADFNGGVETIAESLPALLPFSSLHVLHLQLRAQWHDLFLVYMDHATSLTEFVVFPDPDTMSDESALTTIRMLHHVLCRATPPKCLALRVLGTVMPIPNPDEDQYEDREEEEAAVQEAAVELGGNFVEVVPILMGRAAAGVPLRTLLLEPRNLRLEDRWGEEGDDESWFREEGVYAEVVKEHCKLLRKLVDEVEWLEPDEEGRGGLADRLTKGSEGFLREESARVQKYWALPPHGVPWELPFPPPYGEEPEDISSW